MNRKPKPTTEQDVQPEFHLPPDGKKKSWWGFREKTGWDWLELFIVPLALLLLGALFTALQAASQQRTEELRARNAALQGYLDEMRRLVIEGDLFHPESTTEVKARIPVEPGVYDEIPEVHLLARARTLAVLETLGPSQKRYVMQFLVESNLIDRGDDPNDPKDQEKPYHDRPYVNLDDANLGSLPI